MGTDRGEAARSYLAEQVAVLHATCPLAAAGEDDAVHDARTATRRARAVLAMCRRLLPPGDERVARTGLRTLGHRLGAARDPAVELAWLRDLSRRGGRRRGRRAVPARLVAELESAHEDGLRELRRQLAAPGHTALLAVLDRLAAGPWESVDDESSRIRRGTRRQWRRLDQALTDAKGADAGPPHDAALHAARRQARRARYAAEIVGGEAAHRSAAYAEAVQNTLGSQHDAVLVREAVDAAAARARAAGEPVAPYDDLRSCARRAARRAERDAVSAARRAMRHGHRRWLH